MATATHLEHWWDNVVPEEEKERAEKQLQAVLGGNKSWHLAAHVIAVNHGVDISPYFDFQGLLVGRVLSALDVRAALHVVDAERVIQPRVELLNQF